MQQIQFSKLKVETKKKNGFYESVKLIADNMNEPVFKWLGRLKGWDEIDIYKLYLSANALAKDKKIKFPIALNWHLKEINKDIHN